MECDADVATTRKCLVLLHCSAQRMRMLQSRGCEWAERTYLIGPTQIWPEMPFMIFLVALILPPLALLLYGKIFQAIFNLLIYVLAWVVFIFSLFLGGSPGFVLWLIAALHAILVVNDARKNARAAALTTGGRPTR